MEIALFHKHFSQDHLQEVKKDMERLGAPTIRAIWSDVYGMWMAVEGCHRIRAAKELGLTPIIKDISNQKSVTIQRGGENIKMSVVKLTEELTDDVYRTECVRFEED